MLFERINFSNLNEADVREEIIAPLIRKLGYRSGTRNNIIREQSLRYPKIFIGHKNQKKDPILRGIADYILEVETSIRWVIEAKAPDAVIDNDVIEQAYTYANHPEVRAVYFSICNGRELIVYQTNQSPNSNPIMKITYDEFNSRFNQIEALLSPYSILEKHPKITIDTNNPIGDGLRSIVRIDSGVINYYESSIAFPALKEMQTIITGGAIERNENDNLVAYITTVAPTKSMQELNDKLGLSSFEIYSIHSRLSSDRTKPTIFKLNHSVILPQGEKLIDINTWKEVVLDRNINCHVETSISGYLEENKLIGFFESKIIYNEFNFKISLKGIFKVSIS